MKHQLEPLEHRTLFAGIPGNINFAYDVVLVDAINLKANIASAKKALAADAKTLKADVKTLGNTPANLALLRAAESAGAKAVGQLATATTNYLAKAKPAWRRMEIAAAIFADFPLASTTKQLTAAQTVVDKAQSTPFAKLQAAAANQSAAYTAALASLLAANPNQTQLSADVGAATNAQSTLSTTEDATVSKTSTDTTALRNIA